MNFILYLQNFSDDDLKRHLKKEDIDRVKAAGNFIETYCIAHAGKSKSWLVGVGEKILNWYQKTVNAVKDKIKNGVAVFHNHTETNDHEGRKKVGEVIGTYTDEEGKVIAIIERDKNFRDLKFDVASFESPINFRGDDVEPEDLGDISGIALGFSSENKPAFEHAYRQHVMQCFQKEQGQKQENKMPQLSRKEILQAIQDLGLTPADFIDDETAANLPAVKNTITASNWEAKARSFQKRYEEEYKAHEITKKELTAKVEEATNQLSSIRAIEKVKEIVSKNDKISPQVKAFIEKNISSFKPTAIDKLEIEAPVWIEKNMKDFEEYKAIYFPDKTTEQTTPVASTTQTPPAPANTPAIAPEFAQIPD